MKATIAVEIKPFKVPSFAYIETPSGDDREDMKVPLHMLRRRSRKPLRQDSTLGLRGLNATT